MARRNLRTINNPFKGNKNKTVLYSMVKDIQKELIQKDMELRDKAGEYVMSVIRSKLHSTTESVPGGPPLENGRSFRAGLKKRTKRYYTDVGIGKPGFHAWLVERGHDVIRDGKKIGEAQPRPFVLPSFEEAAPKIKQILSEVRIKDD